jgi:hypothetical protein
VSLNYVDLTMNEISDTIDDEAGKKLTQLIITAFDKNGLSYKVRDAWKPKNVSRDHYRIFCFIKKSKEALIINTGTYDNSVFNIQLRIKDWHTFDKLNEYSENVRNTFLNGCTCKDCGCKKEYVFTYNNIEYRKCHMLCDNFCFRNLSEEDLDPLMQIINNEIAFDKPRLKIR